ncbi:endonuclease/exonuclease/phosphatase family protein [Paraburkholderia sp. MMS20-SJTR3]|uniref:Endonuclease/exonuclease/phosphatase family protein n=1 Tax=Paraburkholderia sejongensis TaxID=2886946 RepID=A0ABS8JZE8_9BURK|nr:endonuclease/exonuclease/phosphatase family protein [Paraburkholderia sp. MMS20-SJTR3]MCC8395284.1 endonuclease/exonuclease/phosphatase family protein [Paraburkholderia sp. MMS20-SJTR3]
MIIATWNMRGAVNVPSINQVAQSTGANIICLQECGSLAEHLQGRTPIVGGDGSIIGYTGNLALGYGFMECVYWENVWGQGSLAVLSNLGISATGIMAPAVSDDFAPNNPRSLPWLSVTHPDLGTSITIYSIHSPPVFGSVTLTDTSAWNNAQIAQIAALGGTWACVGDFNADPTAIDFDGPPSGRIRRGTRATQESGGILDYAITNAENFNYRQETRAPSGSDHYPQVFVW